jgi:FtsP/CotA-like multicopper oxidase with cupredoxin domain
MESEFDGVPETYQEDFGGSSVDLRNGFDYKINSDPNNMRVDNRFVGSHMYHCHVHTIKHLEMGMYGAFVVKSKINPRRISNTLYPNSNNDLQEVLFDDEWIMMISTVDPEYHKPEAKDDEPVFADYNPKYFLINGEEGDTGTIVKPELSKSITVAAGTSKNVVIRLMGIHSTNATFSILSGINNQPVSFTVYNKDGFALKTPKVVTSVELSPGQTKDIMLTVSGAATYNPQVMFTGLRDSTKPYNETYPNSTVLKSIVKTKLTVVQN